MRSQLTVKDEKVKDWIQVCLLVKITSFFSVAPAVTMFSHSGKPAGIVITIAQVLPMTQLQVENCTHILFSHKIITIFATMQLWDCKAKMHQIIFRLGLRPRLHWQGRRTHIGGSYPTTFLHRGGQGVQKLMTIIHVFKHVMYFLAFHKLNFFNFLTLSRWKELNWVGLNQQTEVVEYWSRPIYDDRQLKTKQVIGLHWTSFTKLVANVIANCHGEGDWEGEKHKIRHQWPTHKLIL